MRAGVRLGMDLAQARSMLSQRAGILVEPHQPALDALALHALACLCLRYTPLVCVDGTDGLMLDVSGTNAVHGSESLLLVKMRKQLARLGFAVSIASASSFAGAWALARYCEGQQEPCASNAEYGALKQLPVAALAVDDDTIESLHAVGVQCVGELDALPRCGVLARFDRCVLHRLDCVLGRIIEPAIDPVVPEAPIQHAMVFDGPTDRVDSIEAATRCVLDGIMEQLRKRGQGVRRLMVKYIRPKPTEESQSNAETRVVSRTDGFDVVLSRPSTRASHVWKLVRTKLERLDTGRGVEAVCMTVTRGVRMRDVQAVSDAMGGEPHSTEGGGLSECVDALVARLGGDAVLRVQHEASHLPEQSFRFVPVIHAGSDESDASETLLKSATRCSADDLPQPMPDRPSILFVKPEVAQAMALTPDGPLLSMQWRGHTHRIISCIGPERIGAEWWRWSAADHTLPHCRSLSQPPPDRDYFAAQTDTGRWLFVCRQVSVGDAGGRWFVQGEWA